MQYDEMNEDAKKVVDEEWDAYEAKLRGGTRVIVGYARPVEAQEVEFYLTATPADFQHNSSSNGT